RRRRPPRSPRPADGRPVRPCRWMAAGEPADPAAVSVRPDAVGGRGLWLGAVRGLRRGAGGGDLRRLPAAGTLAAGGAVAEPERCLGGRILYCPVPCRHPAAGDLRAVL